LEILLIGCPKEKGADLFLDLLIPMCRAETAAKAGSIISSKRTCNYTLDVIKNILISP